MTECRIGIEIVSSPCFPLPILMMPELAAEPIGTSQLYVFFSYQS